MTDPLVAQIWPELAALHESLAALPEEVTVTKVEERAPMDRKLTDDEINAIHEGLLKKQKRGGSLGLNR